MPIHPELAPRRFHCRHIFADGHRCGSPALRTHELCYYHHTTRQPIANPRARRGRQASFDLPLPDPTDRTAVQASIGHVLRRIAANQLDPRRAGLLLYGLQIASLNLPRQAPAPLQSPGEIVEEIIADPVLGNLAPAAEFVAPDPEEHFSLARHLLEELQSTRAHPSPFPAPQPTPTPIPTDLPHLQATADPRFDPPRRPRHPKGYTRHEVTAARAGRPAGRPRLPVSPASRSARAASGHFVTCPGAWPQSSRRSAPNFFAPAGRATRRAIPVTK